MMYCFSIGSDIKRAKTSLQFPSCPPSLDSKQANDIGILQ